MSSSWWVSRLQQTTTATSTEHDHFKVTSSAENLPCCSNDGSWKPLWGFGEWRAQQSGVSPSASPDPEPSAPWSDHQTAGSPLTCGSPLQHSEQVPGRRQVRRVLELFANTYRYKWTVLTKKWNPRIYDSVIITTADRKQVWMRVDRWLMLDIQSKSRKRHFQLSYQYCEKLKENWLHVTT